MDTASFESLFPEKKTDFQKFLARKNSVAKRKRSSVTPLNSSIPGIAPKLVWVFESYIQASVYRAADLLDLIEISWAHKRPIGAYILARSLAENTAQMFDIATQTENLVEKNDFEGLWRLITNRVFSTRLKDLHETEETQAVNMLTLIDKTDKTFKGFRENYDRLCEFTHPNQFGMTGHYSRLKKEDFEKQFGNDFGMSQDSLGRIFYSADTALLIFEHYLATLEELLPSVAEICPDYDPTA